MKQGDYLRSETSDSRASNCTNRRTRMRRRHAPSNGRDTFSDAFPIGVNSRRFLSWPEVQLSGSRCRRCILQRNARDRADSLRHRSYGEHAWCDSPATPSGAHRIGSRRPCGVIARDRPMAALRSKTVLTAPKRHFRFAPINGHHQTGPVGPVRAKRRRSPVQSACSIGASTTLMQSSKQHLHEWARPVAAPRAVG